MLIIVQESLINQISHEAVSNEGIQDLTRYGGQTYWAVVAWFLAAPLLENRNNCARLPVVW